MHILVTGAAGFIGSHLCEILLRGGDSVVGIDNYDPYYSILAKQSNMKLLLRYNSFHFIQGDILDTKVLESAIAPQKPEVIIHLAARPGVRASLEEPVECAKVNIQGTVNVFEFAYRNNIQKVMFASSSSVYGNQGGTAFSEDDSLNPVSPYAASKVSCEVFGKVFSQLYNMNITALRFFSVYGEHGRPDMAPFIFTDAILNDKPLIEFGSGDTKRDYTHVNDIVQGIVAAVKTPLEGFQVFNLGNNQPVSLTELIATIEKATGKNAKVIHQDNYLGDAKFSCANIDRAHYSLGYTPSINLEDGIRRLVNWYREEYITSEAHSQLLASGAQGQPLSGRVGD